MEQRSRLTLHRFFIAVLSLTICGAGCKTASISVAKAPLSYPGFQTHLTPRTFDGPGTVFRVVNVGPDKGTSFPVAELDVRNRLAGVEAFPTIKRDGIWSTELLGRFLGIHASSTTLAAKAQFEATVTLPPGKRFRTFDTDIVRALARADIKWRQDSTYYVIREAIAFDSINWNIAHGRLKSVQAEGRLAEIAKAAGAITNIQKSSVSLEKAFEKPHFIFYKVQEIPEPGQHLTGLDFRLIEVHDSLIIIREDR